MPTTTRRIGTCTAPASIVLEGYSPSEMEGRLARGRLETRAYVCDEHARAARREWMPGLTAFDCIADSAEGHACGEVHDLRATAR